MPLLVCAAAVLVHTFVPALDDDPVSTGALGQGCWRITGCVSVRVAAQQHPEPTVQGKNTGAPDCAGSMRSPVSEPSVAAQGCPYVLDGGPVKTAALALGGKPAVSAGAQRSPGAGC